MVIKTSNSEVGLPSQVDKTSNGNIKITPEPGDYYILPPYIQHGFERHSGENNRYCLVFNLHNNPLSHFDYNKKIEKMK